MHRRDLDALLGEARALTAAYMAGGPDAFEAFRDLASWLLHLTVLAPEGVIRLSSGPRGADRRVLAGPGGPTDALPLRDGRFLRFIMILYLDTATNRLKVESSSLQYQADRDGKPWIFRYDYRRDPGDPYPAAHLQVNGFFPVGCGFDGSLERVHFPTGRVSIEAVIRLLADQFLVRCEQPREVWRPVLAETERTFLQIAHRTLAGPDR